MFSFLRLQMHFLAVWLRECFVRPAEPVPPPRLRHRVHGSTDVRGYLEVGRTCWSSIDSLLEAAGLDPRAFRSILDFGCGSGRVVRAIPPPSPGRTRELTGVDIDPAAIAWCQRNLPGIRFAVVQPDPPTAFADGTFDLIFAVSVFTHLDEAMQFSWLAELRRLLRPGGVLVASLHGEYHRSLHGRACDLSRGFAFVSGRTGLLKKDGLPDFYQDAQHTRTYVEREWPRYFEVVHYAERGMAGHQDAVVLRRPGPA